MRRNILSNLVSMLIGAVVFSSLGFAAGYSQQITVDLYPLKYYFNEIEKVPNEGKGFVYKDITYVPLRFIAEAFNSKVDWDDKNFSVKINNKQTAELENQGNNTEKTDNTLTKIAPLKSEITNLHDFTLGGQKFNAGFYVRNLSLGYRDAVIDYYLDGQYVEYKGYFGIYSRYKSYSNLSVPYKAMMIVKGDDKELFRSVDKNEGDLPQPFSIDVTGVQRLTLEFYSQKQSEPLYSAIGDPSLKKLY